jgi:hypothetical protein
LDDEGVSGMDAWMEAGPYTLFSSSLNVTGGGLDLTTTMANKAFTFRGYTSTRGDSGGAKPVIAAGVFLPTQVINMGGSSSNVHYISHIDIDCDDNAIIGLNSVSALYNLVYGMTISNCDGGRAFRRVVATSCSADAGVSSSIGFDICTCIDCFADTCSIGYLTTNAECCIAANCTGDSFNGNAVKWTNCVSYKSAFDGFSATNNFRPTILVNCVSVEDGAYAFNNMNQSTLFNCAHFNESSGRFNGAPLDDIDGIALEVHPFEGAAGGNFSLNNEPTGGALLRAAGLSPFGQTGFLDVGAVQHEDAGGGGGGGSCSIIGG